MPTRQAAASSRTPACSAPKSSKTAAAWTPAKPRLSSGCLCVLMPPQLGTTTAEVKPKDLQSHAILITSPYISTDSQEVLPAPPGGSCYLHVGISSALTHASRHCSNGRQRSAHSRQPAEDMKERAQPWCTPTTFKYSAWTATAGRLQQNMTPCAARQAF